MKPTKSSLGLAIAAALTAFVLLIIIPDRQISPANGESLFTRQGCINCHTFKGKGGYLGPDLTAVMQRRQSEWVVKYIKDPTSRSIKSRMPPFRHLSNREIKSIISYLKN